MLAWITAMEGATMATVIPTTNKILATEAESDLARGVLDTLVGPAGELFVSGSTREPRPLPVEIGLLLQRVLEAMANGADVTVMSIPSEVTTSAAAALLGVSRPTLIKMANEGRIASHRVGTHLRFRSEDVLAEQKSRRERERRAFRELRELEEV